MTRPACGEANGQVTINVTGGSGDYNYSWGDSNTRSDLSSGTYTVTVVENITGCVAEVTFTLLDDVSEVNVNVEPSMSVSCAGCC